MNLIDLLLGIGVIACAVWASKRGFVTMILVTLSLAAAIVIAVHHNDTFTRELAAYFHASPIWVSMWAFVLSSMILFALFRLAARLFARAFNTQKVGKYDQFGGAVVGLIFGWLLMGYLLFLVMFLPLPYVIEERLDSTVLAMKMGASIPFLYEVTGKLHPSQEDFMAKMESSLSGAMRYAQGTKSATRRARSGATDQARINDFLDRIERYFASADY